MATVTEPICANKSVDGISIDPEPNGTFDRLVCEIESFEKKLKAFSKLLQSCPEMDSDHEEEDHSHICTCDELYLNDESDDEFNQELDQFMMNSMGLAESFLYDVINNPKTEVKEDIMNLVSVFETDIINEIESPRSAISRVERYSQSRREVEQELAREKAAIKRVSVVGSSATRSKVQNCRKAFDIGEAKVRSNEVR
ncbi:protein GLE1 [Capsella rubella]|uniref:protein GLE1 n=1 Tax=Capsella rubella TaxID=81985 RepID=UPI000CD4B997|nr:protein GLE1 [Capsella rubella]